MTRSKNRLRLSSLSVRNVTGNLLALCGVAFAVPPAVAAEPPRSEDGAATSEGGAILLAELGATASFSADCSAQFSFVRCRVEEKEVTTIAAAAPAKAAPSPAEGSSKAP